MPRSDDIKTILLIGSGPIVIGQACEFDYSGTQACRVLREEGYRVVLVNSNPATIMTDPEFADAHLRRAARRRRRSTRIIAKERPDALLPTLGGQTGLNLAIALHEAGVLETYDVEMIGANVEAIRTAEDRQRFKVAMTEIGLTCRRRASRTRRRGAAGRRRGRLPRDHPPRVHPRRRRHRHRVRPRRDAAPRRTRPRREPDLARS